MAIYLLGRKLLQRTPAAVCVIDDKDVELAEDAGRALDEHTRLLGIGQVGLDVMHPDAERLKLANDRSSLVPSRVASLDVERRPRLHEEVGAEQREPASGCETDAVAPPHA